MQRTQTAIRTTIISIVVNAVLAAVKIVVGIIGHSFALIADGIESRAVAGVREIEKLRMKKIGLGYFMDIHVQVDGTPTVDDGHRIGHDVQRTLLTSELGITDVVVHIEPYDRPTAAAASRGESA